MRRLITVLVAAPISSSALAHHPLAGMPMETFAHGLLSGIGHPLLGFDHLFFILLTGIAAVLAHRRFLAPVAYIIAMLGGCLVTALGLSVPAVELMIALSLLVLGSMLLSGHRFRLNTRLLIFAGFGLFHGAAFGATLMAQESGFGTPVLSGYLLGLGVTQYAVALAAGWSFLALAKTPASEAMPARLAGAMVAGAGLLLVLEQLEAPILRVIGV